MIRFADKNDVTEIRKLWDIAFSDGKEFNNYFFENIFNEKNTLILRENNELISMAQMINYEIENLGEVTYIYGAATNPKFRGYGYMKKLLKKSFELDIEMNKKASILIPAQESLFDYYKKIGYKTGFHIDRKRLEKTDNLSYSFRKAEYDDINNMLKLSKGDIKRDYFYYKTQMDMFNSLGGNVFVLYDNDKLISYSFVWFENEIDIQELAFEYGEQIIANHIMNYYNQNSAKATILNGNIPFGMIKYHIDNNNYNMTMNLMYN